MPSMRVRRLKSSSLWTRRSALVCATTALVGLVYFCGYLERLESDSLYAHVAALDLVSLSLANVPSSQKNRGREIVEKAYEESYAYVVDHCGNLSQTGLQKCLSRMYLLETQVNSTVRNKWPWWFQTLIRDARVLKTGLFGPWHYLQFTDPTMQLCVYEKGGTKMWRTAHCRYMARNGINTTGTTLTNCFQRQGKLQIANVERTVFLRDPLERYLSGFLDKCAYKTYRLKQPHCHPSVIFQNANNTDVNEFLDQPQQLFQVHVDVSPLNWDLHFLPLSFQCGGLYQKIKDYAFVGKMDDTFYQGLGQFLQRFPTLKTEVEQVFKMQGKENDASVGTEHQASLHARKYFTPNTIRKVLQYYAIDYILLGLSIPDWAEDILQQDETFLL